MFLKNKNIIFKIRRSKVTDYAALKLPNLEGAIIKHCIVSAQGSQRLHFLHTHFMEIDERCSAELLGNYDIVPVVEPTGFICWILYSGIQLYILLSPNLCFIFFLYLDLYLLGDDT